MCQKNSKTTCCQDPKVLKDDIKNCSKEQIKKCHGNLKQHPCLSHNKENQQ